ncbi:CoA pyrophosphatase [Pricia sp. S334]|uniref:CoA pyrophosphatase n=1 Tax=Pricia mediterranea TaxID=3076079 RepID=A0ABU3L8K1_9FLAO|nr:CoA pyrophosphatase [Pricia sp. S334]MDT7830002.1 CoA pyrophosphatase [Pricia sp. S334]
MDFDDFVIRTSKIKDLPLPGEASHLKMVPDFRLKELRKARAAPKHPKKAGVMALFYPDAENTVRLLFILRKNHPKDIHANQIGFPGGRAEKGDVDLSATALRETREEVGISSEKIEVLRGFTEIYIPPSNFEVKPFMGLHRTPTLFIPQVSEVAALIEVPLMDIMDESNLRTENLSTSYARDVKVPAFRLNGYTVWGATGMMLNEMRTLLRQVL